MQTPLKLEVVPWTLKVVPLGFFGGLRAIWGVCEGGNI